LGVPPAIVDCIRGLLDPSPSLRWSLTSAQSVLDSSLTWAATDGHMDTWGIDDPAGVVRKTIDYIHSMADYAREDRLFPAAPEVFETNPLNLAYGACGVACAIRAIAGDVPEEIRDWIVRRPITRDLYPPGLYVGIAGVSWGLLEIGLRDEAASAMRLANDHPLLDQSPDLFFGITGWGMAQLRFFVGTADEEYLSNAKMAARRLSEMANREDGQCWWTYDGDECSGLGHGTAGVCLFLLYLYKATGDTQYLHLGLAGLERLKQKMVRKPDGPISWRVRESSRTVTPHWRWGSAGVGMVILRYEHVLRDARYEQILNGVIANTDRKLTIFPGLHIGLAGMGEFFNDLRQFGWDREVAEKGARMALGGLLLFKIVRDQGIAFPGATRTRISCDLSTGSAGIAWFVNRFLYGGNAPFMLDELLEVQQHVPDDSLRHHHAGASAAVS
ncbi:MAG: lanthionine synthetase C family protein, partial [Candidatus Binatia bacterium]